MRSVALACIALLGGCGPSPPPSTDAATHPDAQSDATSHEDAGPIACPAPCEGDSVCSHVGYCRTRPDGDFDPSCVNNLTIRIFPCAHTYDGFDFVAATVCNRGSAAAAADQVVRFESAGEVICETRTIESIAPGGCAEAPCPLGDLLGNVTAADTVRATVNPDGAGSECGDPLDNSMESAIAIGCE
jgi:hypothetical protein